MKEPPQHHHHHHLEDEDNDEEEKARGNGISKDDIVPSYDFQPIRPLAASNSNNFDSAAFSRPWNSDSNSNASPPILKVTFFSFLPKFCVFNSFADLGVLYFYWLAYGMFCFAIFY